MAADPDHRPNQSPARQPLGALLIQRGFLSEEQLAVALADQQRTNRSLGEIIVGLGFVPGALVAQALATQQGGLLRTEWGLAVGFGDTLSSVAFDPPPSSEPVTATERAPRLIAGSSAPTFDSGREDGGTAGDSVAAQNLREDDALAVPPRPASQPVASGVEQPQPTADAVWGVPRLEPPSPIAGPYPFPAPPQPDDVAAATLSAGSGIEQHERSVQPEASAAALVAALPDLRPAQIEKLPQYVPQLEMERDSACADLGSVEVEREQARAEIEAVAAERGSARAEVEMCVRERDSARAEAETALAERDAALAEVGGLAARIDAAQADIETAVADRDAARAELETVLSQCDAERKQAELDSASAEGPDYEPASAQTQTQTLQRRITELEADIAASRAALDTGAAEIADLRAAAAAVAALGDDIKQALALAGEATERLFREDERLQSGDDPDAGQWFEVDGLEGVAFQVAAGSDEDSSAISTHVPGQRDRSSEAAAMDTGRDGWLVLVASLHAYRLLTMAGAPEAVGLAIELGEPRVASRPGAPSGSPRSQNDKNKDRLLHDDGQAHDSTDQHPATDTQPS